MNAGSPPDRPQPLDSGTSGRLAKQKQRGTKVEEIVAGLLRRHGVPFRRNVRTLPGSPDFANQRRRWAIFVNGCFWHRHSNCRRATIPRNNRAFWISKFAVNRRRDAIAICTLRRRGFQVVLLWECEIGASEHRLAKVFEASGVQSG